MTGLSAAQYLYIEESGYRRALRDYGLGGYDRNRFEALLLPDPPTAACPACGQPCTWTASPHHGTATDCGCPPDTGTGASEGEVGAPVPAPSTAPGDNPVDNCASAGDNRPATAGFPLIQARRPVESPAAQGFST